MATEAGADRKRSNSADTEENGYTSDEITVLRGLDPVRKRPGMYIGSTGPRGLHHLVYEVVDNSVDEALAGHCDRIELTLHPDNSVTVADDGRGIPVDEHPEEKRPAAEVVLTMLHAGGKFGGEGSGYKVSGGLHGVGVSVVNALSERLHLEVRRDGYKWTQDYERGEPKGDLKRGEKIKGTGTTITWLPDDEVFETLELDYDTLAERMRETAFLTRGLEIKIIDERGAGQSDTFLYKGGIVDFVKHLNENKDAMHRKPVFFENETEDGAVEVAMQWNSSYQESVFSFANNINTHEGGSHLSGFRSALTRTLNAYARNKGLLKEKDENLSGDDVREGLTAVISVKLAEPQFEGQTKSKLGNPPVEGLVKETVNRKLGEFLEEHPADARRIVSKSVDAARARDGGAKGPRPHAPQVGARELDPAGQARRLHGPRPGARGAVHRRGRFGRRLGQAGSRPQHPGGAAASRQDSQRREEPHRQDPQQRDDPGDDHRDRDRRRRGVQPRGGPLPQDHRDDRRRRRRRSHPHPGAHLPLPRAPGPDRGRATSTSRRHRSTRSRTAGPRPTSRRSPSSRSCSCATRWRTSTSATWTARSTS